MIGARVCDPQYVEQSMTLIIQCDNLPCHVLRDTVPRSSFNPMPTPAGAR